MKTNRIITAIAVFAIGAMLSGCATVDKSYTGRKNTLVKDVKPGYCTVNEKAKDWTRIAKMTNEEICKALGCEAKEKIVTKEVIKEVPVEKIVTKEVIKEVPVEKIVEKEVKKPFLTLPGVLFDFDKATLRPAGKAEVEKAVKDLKAQGEPSIVISGHTDSFGTDAYNMKLSQNRADSVKAFMVSKEYPAAKISTKAFGESKPVASNKTAAGRQQNRRVEIELVD
jgi:outer membrane protein OmpA-like peptidoglycan-associated protein